MSERQRSLPRPPGWHASGTPPCCRICGAPLTLAQTLRGLCDGAECRRRDVPHQLRLREQATAEQARRLAGAAGAGRAVVLLPDGVRPLVPLSAERRESFARHLDGLLRSALAEGTQRLAESRSDSHGLSAADLELGLLGPACALCGGLCCHSGGETAWLEPATLQRFAAAQPQLAGPQIRDAYLERLPQAGLEGSCVFHGDAGCALPREMRSSICNGFICADLAATVNDWRAAGESCLAVARSGAVLRRIALVDGQSMRPLPAPAGTTD